MTSSSMLLILCVTMAIVPSPVQQDTVMTRYFVILFKSVYNAVYFVNFGPLSAN